MAGGYTPDSRTIAVTRLRRFRPGAQRVELFTAARTGRGAAALRAAVSALRDRGIPFEVVPVLSDANKAMLARLASLRIRAPARFVEAAICLSTAGDGETGQECLPPSREGAGSPSRARQTLSAWRAAARSYGLEHGDLPAAVVDGAYFVGPAGIASLPEVVARLRAAGAGSGGAP